MMTNPNSEIELKLIYVKSPATQLTDQQDILANNKNQHSLLLALYEDRFGNSD